MTTLNAGPGLRARRAHGFTLVEAAVVLAVTGLLLAGAGSAAASILASVRQARVDAGLRAMADRMTAFSATRFRLPCPDASGAGHEGLVDGDCPASLRVGWVPYLALGLPQPAPAERARYGVYRASAADPAGGNIAGAAALLRRIATAAALPANADEVQLAGDGTAGQPAGCLGMGAANPAFVILAPGEDRDGDGERMDGIHAPTGLCFASPTRPMDSGYDDRTVAVGWYDLMATLHP